MNKKTIWIVAGGVLAGLILVGFGYKWGRQQNPSFSLPAVPLLPSHQKIPKGPLSEFFNGLTLQTSLVTPEGKDTATIVRTQPESYRVEITVHAVLPQPNLSTQQISKLVPTLPETIRSFNSLMDNAALSSAFTQLYENKVTALRQNLTYLDRTVSRQNFYDCETVVHLQNPLTGRRALLGIGPMDVNTDGSDGDRNVKIEKSSLTFQSTTSYRWPKLSKRLNPFIKSTERELTQVKQELSGHQPSEKTPALKQRREFLTFRLRELKRWSFLASTADPFIVLPGFFFRSYSGPFAPKIGDFALVLFGGAGYPAIVGDVGPSYKFGEASLRICRQINKTSSGVNRAVSSLRVAYLIFPGTALQPWQTPDLKVWNARCTSLFEELGGDPQKVFQWQNNIPPWPTPTPHPTPLLKLSTPPLLPPSSPVTSSGSSPVSAIASPSASASPTASTPRIADPL